MRRSPRMAAACRGSVWWDASPAILVKEQSEGSSGLLWVHRGS